MKIYLIGMPGSGKSTLGKQLASALNETFIDLDLEIEKQEGKSVAEIFSQHGEDYFRQSESKLLHQFAASDASFIMATGGGAPIFLSGISVINSTGISIFLDVPLQTLVKNTSDRSTRPLLGNANTNDLEKKLFDILNTRLSIYQQARITLAQPTLSSVLKALGFERKA